MSVIQGGFARNKTTAAATTEATTESRPKVNVWINIGYMSGKGEDAVFVSLPTGIALDTMKPVSTKGSNVEFVDFQVARNDMLLQFMEIADQLKPGEDTIIPAEMGLAIQIRRVQEEKPEAVLTETNRFAKTLFQRVG